jgi:lipopolysaccharide biosynthesis glycosyltransferase
MSKDDSLHIAVGSDLNYLPHVGTLFRSIVENNRNHRLAFHLLTMDSRVPDDERLNQFIDSIRSENISVHIHLVKKDEPILAAIPDGGVIASSATFLRFLVPSLVKADKILYLDCDMIVHGDLQPLFQTDLNDRIAAVVSELFVSRFAEKLSLNLRYFNAGMMLFNAAKWRDEGWLEKSIRFINEKFAPLFHGKKNCGDQDILNMICLGQVVYVHPRYNMVNPIFLRRIFFQGKLFVDAYDNPVIIHFAGGAKPWNRFEVHPLTPQYLAYRRQTPWSDVPPQKVSIRVLCRFAAMWWKYHFPLTIYPINDLFRRLSGHGTRIVTSERIEYLMNETGAARLNDPYVPR